MVDRVRHAISRARVAGDDLDGGLGERHIEQGGRLARKSDDVGAHPLGLGVDVDPENPVCGRHRAAPTARPACVPALPGAVHDGRRREAALRRLLFDLGGGST